MQVSVEDTSVCPICMEPVLDEGANGDGSGQDAVYCEGDCKCWHHRWCASVTKESLQECLKALTDKVRSLKATVATLQTLPKSSVPKTASVQQAVAVSAPHHYKQRDKEGMSWSTVVKKGRGGRQQAPRINPSNSALNGRQQQHPREDPLASSSLESASKPGQPDPGKERVAGVRRLWGTFKSTSTSVVKTTLTKLISVGNSVSVRRKYKSLDSG